MNPSFLDHRDMNPRTLQPSSTERICTWVFNALAGVILVSLFTIGFGLFCRCVAALWKFGFRTF